MVFLLLNWHKTAFKNALRILSNQQSVRAMFFKKKGRNTTIINFISINCQIHYKIIDGACNSKISKTLLEECLSKKIFKCEKKIDRGKCIFLLKKQL